MAKYDWVKKIDLSRFSQRERVLLLVTATAVGIFLLFFVYLPAHRHAAGLAAQRDQIRQEVLELEQQVEESRRVAKRLKADPSSGPDDSGEVTGLPTARGTYGPRNQRLSVVLDELQRLSRPTAVDFISIRPDQIVDQGEFWTQSMLLNLRSTFKGLGKYLQVLENLPRIVDVRDVKVEADPSQSAYVTADLYITVYLEKN